MFEVQYFHDFMPCGTPHICLIRHDKSSDESYFLFNEKNDIVNKEHFETLVKLKLTDVQ